MSKIYNSITGTTIIDSSTLSEVTINSESNNDTAKIDLKKLSQELSILRQALVQEANKTEDHVAIGNIASAEIAANEGNESKTKEFLSKAGNWVFDVATKIGVSLAANVIKSLIGI